MNKIPAILLALLLCLSIPVQLDVDAVPRHPVGILGYVTWADNGTAVPNLYVTVTNIETGEYANATTNATGLFVTSLYAYNNERLYANATLNGVVGSTTVNADVSETTQWMNFSLGEGGQPPTCFFTFNPKNPCDGETVYFSDSSSDLDGQILKWEWRFGDGGIGYGKHVDHVYANPGSYHITLTVTDDDGFTAWSRKQIDVLDCNGDDDEEYEMIVPPLPPPLYPNNPYTVPEMYDMLDIDELHGGGGVKVAVIDTGFSQMIYAGVNLGEITGYAHSSLTTIIDNVGHGTWCNYAVAYGIQNLTSRGKQYSIKVIEEGGCTAQVLVDALEMAEQLDVDVVSISLGGRGGSIADPIAQKVDDLRRKGIIVVCAAGNDGPISGTINTPGLSGSAITVGSVDPMFTLDLLADDNISIWSSRGPVHNLNEIKPDCVAGGESIIGPYGNNERVLSGTSMSTPVVAGGVAVVYSNNAWLYDSLKWMYFFHKSLVPDIFEKGIEETAYEKGDGYIYGHGIPQFTDVDDYCFWHGLFWFILWIVIVVIIIIIAILLIWRHYKKKKGEKPTIHHYDIGPSKSSILEL